MARKLCALKGRGASSVRRGKGWFSDMFSGLNSRNFSATQALDKLWNTIHPGSSEGKWYADRPSAPAPAQAHQPPPRQHQAPPPPPPQYSDRQNDDDAMPADLPADLRALVSEIRQAGSNPSAELQKKMRKIALKYHPDKNQGNSRAGKWYQYIQRVKGWGMRRRR